MKSWVLILVAIAGAVGGAGAMLAWSAYGAMPGAVERAQTERIVREYILAHPEILPEAMDVLRTRETGRLVAAEGPSLTKAYASAWAGNPKGDVTIVEYFDYNCGYCRAVLPEVDRLLAADPRLKIVYREFPILAEESRIAARFSLVAAQQGKFEQFHRALYQAGAVNEASIVDVLRSIGIDPAAARTAAMDPRIDAELDRNLQTARRLGMSGTPSWVIGDHVVSSLLSFERLQQLVAEARAQR